MRIKRLFKRVKYLLGAGRRVDSQPVWEPTDLQIVLQFFHQPIQPNRPTVLVVDKAQYIPYVRRALFKELGEPSRMVGHQMWYGRRCISVVSASRGEAVTRGTDAYQIDTW